MMLELLQRLERLERQMHSIVLLGSIEQADYSNARVKVRIGDLVTGWLPWLTHRAGGDVSWHAPEIGEQVMVFSPSGELGNGVVLPALYQSAHPANGNNPDEDIHNYKDGAVIAYNRQTHHLSAVLPAGASTELISSTIHFKGKLTLDGDFIHNGNETKTGNTTQTGNVAVSGTGSIGKTLAVVGAVSAAGVSSSTSMTTPVMAVGGVDVGGHTHQYSDSDNGITTTKTTGVPQ